jgi:hypothetical protein
MNISSIAGVPVAALSGDRIENFTTIRRDGPSASAARGVGIWIEEGRRGGDGSGTSIYLRCLEADAGCGPEVRSPAPQTGEST